MNESENLEKIVSRELRAGGTRSDILRRLSREHDEDELRYYLNQLPEKRRQQPLRWLNLLLCLLLFGVTVKKLYFLAMLQLTAVSVGKFSPLLLLDLIVPMINFFILYKLLRFQRQGYQFMAILGVLALFRAENRIIPDGPLYLVIIGLALFLFFRLFPKKELL